MTKIEYNHAKINLEYIYQLEGGTDNQNYVIAKISAKESHRGDKWIKRILNCFMNENYSLEVDTLSGDGRDKGLCQWNLYWQRNIVNHPEFLNRNWQLQMCINRYIGWIKGKNRTVFYGCFAKWRHNKKLYKVNI